MKLCLIALLACTIISTNKIIAQDSVVVQTFDFNSTVRKGTFAFPPDTSTWQKILMQYRIRCKKGQVSSSNNALYGCGEWDYSCNTYITDSSLTDSVKSKHNSYDITNFNGTTFSYTYTPVYTYYQYIQKNMVYSVINENLASVGNGATLVNHPLANGVTSGKTQYLYTAAELIAAGVVAGDISGMELDIPQLGAQTDFLRIKIKATSLSQLTQIDNTPGFNQVYFLNTPLSNVGYNRFQFYSPFNWNGTSNIIVEINYNGKSANSGHTANAASTVDAAVTSMTDDYNVKLNGSSYGDAGDINELDSVQKFTLQAWVKINKWKNWAGIFNKDGKTTMELGDVLDRVYCIVRNPNNSYGYASGVLPLNTWTHLTMVYDGTKVSNGKRLRFYVNGAEVALTYSGSIPNKTAQSTQVQKFLSGIDGQIDDVHIWNEALDSAAIAGWMYKKIDTSHPFYSSLLANYEMNEGLDTVLTDVSTYNRTGYLRNGIGWDKFDGNKIFKNLVPVTARPNINFAQGTYTNTLQDIIITDSLLNNAQTVTSYTVNGTNLDTVYSLQAWQAGYGYVYDEAGAIVDSVMYAADSTVTISMLDYYAKWPSRFEIMSFVTPYGNNLDLGLTGKMYEFDVTDFAPVLKNNKYISIERGGEWQEEMDIKFIFIKGTPPAPVLSIRQLWPVTYDNYTNILNDYRFEPRTVTMNAAGAYFKLKSAITGHGQDGEFTYRTHYMNVDSGLKDFQWLVKKECALNPVYPQGGTWVYDRAGWCPGMATDVKEFDITPLVTPGQDATFDYGINVVTGASNYIVNNQIVEYGAASFTVDASVIDIVKPNDKIEHGRGNPVCMNPIVQIKNTGSTTITSLDIHYGMEGSALTTFTWNGTLPFMDTAFVPLNIANWSNTAGTFIAYVSNPNATTDQYAQNDTVRSNYVLPVLYPPGIIVEVKTNNQGSGTKYKLKNDAGTVLVNRLGLSNNTIYSDTLILPLGCYEFQLTDVGNDGLSWWANTAQGTGYCRIKKIDGTLIKVFNPDFGAEIYQQFGINLLLGESENNSSSTAQLNVFPNPASDKADILIDFAKSKDAELRITDLQGKIINQHSFKNIISENYSLDCATLSKGIYAITLISADEVKTVRLVIQ